MKAKAKVIAIVAALVMVLIGCFLFLKRNSHLDTAASADPTHATSSDEIGGSQTLDPTMTSKPWGVILFDGVKVVDAADKVGKSDAAAVFTLNTGDQVSIDGVSSQDNQFVVVINETSGQSGWISASQVLDLSRRDGSGQYFHSSTTPLAQLFISEPDDTESVKKKYGILGGEDFIKRASKNPNPEVAEWARQVTDATGSSEPNQ